MFAANAASSSSSAATLYADDVFAVHTYTGTGAALSVVNGIDLSTNGGMVWTKGRSTSGQHVIADTSRGTGVILQTSTTAANTSTALHITAFNSDGYSIGTYSGSNTNTTTYGSWTFRNAPKFFTHSTKAHTNGVASTVDLSTLGTVGMVVVKRTGSTGNWFVWHRSLAAGKLLYLNLTNAATTDASISVSGTTLTLASTLATDTYLVQAFAHDDSASGLIQCGVINTDGSGNGSATLGWEPQYLLTKTGTTAETWEINDSTRGWWVDSGSQSLYPNTSAVEFTDTYPGYRPNASGWTCNAAWTSEAVIYVAIRQPNKPPTSGASVFHAVNYAGNGVVNSITAGSMKYVDTAIWYSRNMSSAPAIVSRRNPVGASVATNSTAAETIYSGGPHFDVMGGLRFTNGSYNSSGDQGMWCIKRASGVHDTVFDTGTGSAHTVSHNLGATPELIIRKKRSATDNWHVYAGDATDYLLLNTTAATADLDTIWNDTAPTASVFTVGSHDDVNQSGGTFVTQLFATLAGVSKVGTYTGNGSNQTINCGFAAGARFILIKRTDSTGDWYAWDHTNGIVSGNDPHISLNSSANPVTTDDSVDPDNSGFIVNQVAATNVNVNAATYLFLAIA